MAWKAVARADLMLTKQFSGASSAQMWLDWDAMPSLDTEQRLSRLAGWVLAAEQSGARYGLRLPGVQIAPERGEAHRGACLQAHAVRRLVH